MNTNTDAHLSANRTAPATNAANAAATARHTAWPRLAAAARAAIAADARDLDAPYGFATRVVAIALGPKHAASAPLLVNYAMRAFGISCLLAILLVSINLGAILRDIDDEAATLNDTTVETADIDNGIATDTAAAAPL